MAPALELLDIHKSFGAVRALAGASFTALPGEVHALLGENGAGKSTLMHIAYGMLAADRGEVRVDGRPVSIRSPREARALGIGMVHQHFTSVPALSVEENLQLAGGRGRRPEPGADDQGRAEPLVGSLLTGIRRDALVETLSVGQKQRLEVAKALDHGARVLLLDEPTSVLVPAEVAELIRLAREFAAAGGAAVFITHKLREVFAAADRVTVLRHGRVTTSGRLSGRTMESLAQAMIGHRPAPAELPPIGVRPVEHAGETRPAAATPAPVVVLERVTTLPDGGRGPGLRDATLAVSPGEILGVAAIEGNGQRELMFTVAGLLTPAAGRVQVTRPVVLVPEDRTTEGLVPDLTLAENVLLGSPWHASWVRRGWIDWSAVDAATAGLIAAHDVLAPGPGVRARVLSGGNQQKLILARALEQHPAVLVVENPTRGLDVQATVTVRTRLREAAGHGVAILVHSGDLDEVLELADRVVVVADGRVREMPRGVTREAVGVAMLGIAGT